jgi:DNA-directed RNA polymerase subunit RPC12/RpoP/translation initiation factor 2 beta subunit (eIF-2beta)/eIF-5
MIVVPCPECGKKVKASDDLAGKRTTCPQCGARVLLPALEEEPSESKARSSPPRKSRAVLWIGLVSCLLVIAGAAVLSWFLYLAPLRQIQQRDTQPPNEEKQYRMRHIPILREADRDALQNFEVFAMPFLQNPKKLPRDPASQTKLHEKFAQVRDTLKEAVDHFSKPPPSTRPNIVQSQEEIRKYLQAWYTCYQDLAKALEPPPTLDSKKAKDLLQQYEQIRPLIENLRDNPLLHAPAEKK